MIKKLAVVVAGIALLIIPTTSVAAQTAAQRRAAMAVADGNQGVNYLIHHHPSLPVIKALTKYGHWGIDSGGTISSTPSKTTNTLNTSCGSLCGCAGLWWDRHYFYVAAITVAWVKLFQGGWCWAAWPWVKDRSGAITSYQGQWTSRWSTAPWCWYNIGDAWGYNDPWPSWRRSGEESDLSPWLPGPGCLDTTVSGGDVIDWVGYGMENDVPTEYLH